MKSNRTILAWAIALLAITGVTAKAATIEFSDYTWVVRPSGKGGPGPNNWTEENVSVDSNGYLHLKLSRQNDQWYCSEVYTQKRLGFGRYEFWISGPVDKLDRNVVLGLFNYPPSDAGPDGTHEIDIEFARWGNAAAPNGNYTVWPTITGTRPVTKSFSFTLSGSHSIHNFVWSPAKVVFQSQYGEHDGSPRQLAHWVYQPANPTNFISQATMPVHINLWCFQGKPPADGQPVEVIIRAFQFLPIKGVGP